MFLGQLGNVVDTITGHHGKKIKGSVVLMKKNVLDFNAIGSGVIDRVGDFLGNGISLQLVSATHGDLGI